MDGDRLTKKVFMWSKHNATFNCNNWVNSVEKFMLSNHLEDAVTNPMSDKSVIKLAKPILQNLEDVKWLSKLWNDNNCINGNKLRIYRRFKTQLLPETYLDLNQPVYKRSVFTKLRCGVLPLELETGR